MSLVEYRPNDLAEPKARSGTLLPPVYEPAVFEQMQRIAKMMAFAPLVPDHLKVEGNLDASLANCLLVVNQALKWKMDPFAVAQETFVHAGKIGYSGKLVAAALQSCLGIKLYYYFEGNAGSRERRIVVRDKPKGEETDREINGTVAQWSTTDKSGNINASWAKQPDDMLVYRGTRQWCRRYEPQVILGVLTEDELDEIAAHSARDVTPPRVPVRRGPPPAPQIAAETIEADPVSKAAPRPSGPPPAPTPESAPETDEPLAKPAEYLSHLSEQMLEASTREELEDIWSAHKDIAPRLPEKCQQSARELLRHHHQRLMG